MTIQTNGDDCHESGAGQTSREQFEAWIVSLPRYTAGDIRKIADGQYEYMETEWCYRAWQASRAAIEITLPPKISDVNVINGIVRPEASAFDEAIDDCAEVLKEAGITVKEDA